MSYPYIHSNQNHIAGPYGSLVVSPNTALTQSTSGNSILHPNLLENQLNCSPIEITNNTYLPSQSAQMSNPHLQQSYINTQGNYQIDHGPQPFPNHLSSEYSQQGRFNGRGNFLGPQNAPQQWRDYQSQQVQHQYNQQSQQIQSHQQGQQFRQTGTQQQQQNKHDPETIQTQISISSGQYANHLSTEQYPQQINTSHQNQPQILSQSPLQQLQQPAPQQQNMRYANQVSSSDASPWQSPYQFTTSQASSQNQWERFDYAIQNDQNHHFYGQQRIPSNETNPARNGRDYQIPSNSFVLRNQQREQYPHVQAITHNNEISSFKRQASISSDSTPQGIYTNSFSNPNGSNLHVNASSERKAALELSHNDLSAQQHMVANEISSHPGLERQLSGQNYQPANEGRISQLHVATDGSFSPGRQYGHQNSNDMNMSATQSQSEKQFHFKNQPQPPVRMPVAQIRPPAPLQPHFHSQPRIQDFPQHHNAQPNSQLQLQSQPQSQIGPHPQNWSQFQEETQERIRPQTSVNGMVITSINMSNQSSTPFYQTAGPAPQNSRQALQLGHSSIAFANHFESGSRPSHATNAQTGISTGGGQGIPYTVSAPLPSQQVNFNGPSTMGGYMSAPSTPDVQTSIPLASDASARISNVAKYSSPVSQGIPFQAHSMNSQEIHPNIPQSQNRSFVPASGIPNQHNLVSHMQGLSLQNRRESGEINGVVGPAAEYRNEAHFVNRPTFANSANMIASDAGCRQRFAIDRDTKNPFVPQSPNTGASGHRLGPNNEVVRFPAPNATNNPIPRLHGVERSLGGIDPQTAHRFMHEPPTYARPSIAGQSAAMNSQNNQGLEMKSLQPASMHSAYPQPFGNRVVTSGHSVVSSGHPIVIMPGYASNNIPPNRGQRQSNFEARTESILQHISDKQGPMYDKLKKVLTDVFVIQDEVSAFKGRRGISFNLCAI